MTPTFYKQETAASLLCSRLSRRVNELDKTHADMKCTPIDDRLAKWTAFDRQIGDLVNHFQSLVRLAQIVCGSSEISLNQLEALQGNSGAIGAGAVDLIKKQRMEAFEHEAMKAPTPSIPSQKLSEENSHYPVEKFNIDNIGELSYILPEKHGWLLVFSKELRERLLSTSRFRFVLEISGDQTVDYGIYRASELRGQAMSGLEFSHLTDKTKVKITKAISQAKVGAPHFLETMENLLYSKRSIPCLFLECLETAARSRQALDQSVEWDVNGLCYVHPFPSVDSTRSSPTCPPFIMDEGGQYLGAKAAPVVPQPLPSSTPFQSIANWDLRRTSESKVPGIFPTPISARNRQWKHPRGSENISDQEN